MENMTVKFFPSMECSERGNSKNCLDIAEWKFLTNSHIVWNMQWYIHVGISSFFILYDMSNANWLEYREYEKKTENLLSFGVIFFLSIFFLQRKSEKLQFLWKIVHVEKSQNFHCVSRFARSIDIQLFVWKI